MRSEDNVYYLRVRPVRVVAATRAQKQPAQEFLRTGFYIVAGALLGLGLANLPSLSGAFLTALNILPSHLI